MVVSPLLVSLRRAVLLAAAFLFLVGPLRAEPGKDFTPWMSLSDLNAYLEELDGDKPGGKNYWDRGNWIDAMEGRWEAGIPQYRIRYSAVPPRRAYWWLWYFNQDRKSFDTQVHKLADEGFALVHFNSYVRPGGEERFQGVWHKLVPLTGAAVLPPGKYVLTEIEGNAYSGNPVGLTIEDTKYSGRGFACSFKGSVRDRYSGSVDISRIGERPSELTPRELQQETVFLKMLENANWQERDGKLRVIKEGKTVLRFVPEQSAVEAAPAK